MGSALCKEGHEDRRGMLASEKVLGCINWRELIDQNFYSEIIRTHELLGREVVAELG